MTDHPDRHLPRWLEWAREIQALAQTGLHYAPDDYHRQRYRRLTEIAAEITAEHAALPRESVMRVFLAPRGYATPKIDVRGAVFRGGKILLVRERSDGGWCLPGGWGDVGELPSAMVEREVREESGVEARAARVAGVFDANREDADRDVMHVYKIVFLCDDLGGEPHPSDETSAAGFFGIEEIPALSERRTSLRILQAVFARCADSAMPPAFD
ncbi:MAG: NUDIX hydrolase N-terminal domain-containing protein [Anaerolineales bacterium]|nr:NUDIX hydrolase N-terminal domain-containing protein [Anaerolineales bacterium]